MGKILIIANIFQLINHRSSSIVVVVHCSQIILYYFAYVYVEILHRLLNLDQF
jgi:hypothetical protein